MFIQSCCLFLRPNPTHTTFHRTFVCPFVFELHRCWKLIQIQISDRDSEHEQKLTNSRTQRHFFASIHNMLILPFSVSENCNEAQHIRSKSLLVILRHKLTVCQLRSCDTDAQRFTFQVNLCICLPEAEQYHVLLYETRGIKTKHQNLLRRQ